MVVPQQIQTRSGRFGEHIQSQQQQQQEIVKPEDIAQEQQAPPGRFGRGLQETRALQEKASTLNQIRQQAISIAQQLEQDFFSQHITTEQAREAYSQVDPLVRQFIKTTPEKRDQMAQQAIQSIKDRIAQEQQNIANLQRTDPDNLDIYEKEQLINQLSSLVREAQSGAYSFEELFSYAERSAQSKASQFSAKRQAIQNLTTQGIPRDIAEKLANARTAQVKLTSSDIERLSPQARQALGVKETTTTTTTNVSTGLPQGAIGSVSGGGFLFPAGKVIDTWTAVENDITNLNQTLVVKPVPISSPQGTIYNIELPAKMQQETFKPFNQTELLINQIKDIKTLPLALAIPETAVMDILAISTKGYERLGIISEEKNFQININKPSLLGLGEFSPVSFSRISNESPSSIYTIPFSSEQALNLGFGAATFAAFPITSTITFEASVLGKLGGGYKISPLTSSIEEKSISIPELASAGLIAGLEGYKFLTKDIEITRELPKSPEIKEITKITNIRQGEKLVDLAQFEITVTKSARFSYVAPRLDILTEKIANVFREIPAERLPLTTKEFDLNFVKELKTRYPQGRFIKIEKATAGIVLTETFITKGGKIVKPAFRDSDIVAFASQKSTETKVGSLVIGKIEGEVEQQGIRLATLNRESLSGIDKKILQSIEEIQLGKGVKATKIFGKEAELKFGSTETKDLLKISSRGEVKFLDIEKKARSVRRSTIGIVQEPKINIEFGKEIGLKEIEIIEERIAAVDITYPRFKSPKKAELITGYTFRREINLPEPRTDFGFTKSISKNKGLKLQKVLGQDIKIPEKALSITQVRGSLALKAKSLIKTRVIPASSYLKQSEKLGELSRNVNKLSAPLRTKLSTSQFGREQSRELFKTGLREQTLNVSSVTTKVSAKTINKEMTRDLTKSISKLSSKLTTKLVTKQVTKTITKTGGNNLLRINVPRASSRDLIIPGLIFQTRTQSIKARKKRRSAYGEAIVEGFTARILKFPGMRIREKDLGKVLKLQKISPIRLRPIIISNRRLYGR